MAPVRTYEICETWAGCCSNTSRLSMIAARSINGAFPWQVHVLAVHGISRHSTFVFQNQMETDAPPLAYVDLDEFREWEFSVQNFHDERLRRLPRL